MGYEQLPFRQSLKGEIARNIALFEQTPPSRPLTVIRPGWDQELLGCSLSQYAGIGFCVYAVATQHQGQFSTSWFDAPELQFVTSHIPLALMRDVLDHEFTGDRDRAIAKHARHQTGRFGEHVVSCNSGRSGHRHRRFWFGVTS